MVLVWLLFGVVVGAGSGPAADGVIGVLAGAIAGVLLFPLVGAALGLLGGRAREALLGGACGLLAGVVAGLAGRRALLPTVNTCLVAGALVGATLPAYLRLLGASWRMTLRACLGYPAVGRTARTRQTSAPIKP
jgi:hypothetical protein